MKQLYLIEILRQTTTHPLAVVPSSRCILLKFYVKPQLYLQGIQFAVCCILLKFYVKPQLFVMIGLFALSCILLKFYVKPQLVW